MKIISKFKDYYDSMRCYSMCSDDFTYIRKKQTHNIDGIRNNDFTAIDSRSVTFKYTISRFIIGFCGKFYLGHVVIKPSSIGIPYKEIGIYYDTDLAIIASIDNKYIKKVHKLNSSPLKKWSVVRTCKKGTVAETKLSIVKYIRKSEKNWFDKKVKLLNKENLFKKYNTPYFAYTHNTPTFDTEGAVIKHNLLINPVLKDFEFFKIFDGHRCYQEIEMYLGNELLKKNNAPQIVDDKVKIQQHGFDLKKSFRKAPTKNVKRKTK